jgi:hypothetical protein
MTQATSNSCAPATSVGTVTASGVDAVALSSPTIFNYPRQPPRDDGRLLALASLVGGFLDAILGGDGIDQAVEAENTWKGILDNIFYPRGQSELQRVDTTRQQLPQFEEDLLSMMQDYRIKADRLWPLLAPLDREIRAQIEEAEVRSDGEWAHLNPLDEWLHGAITTQEGLSNDERALAAGLCTADALDKLCEFVACGYTPDYRGISERTRADAQAAIKVTADTICRTSKRYHVRASHHHAAEVSAAVMTAAISAASRGREAERLKAFELNHKMRYDHAQFLETTRMNRMQFANKQRNDAEKLADTRWRAHFEASNTLDQRSMAALHQRWLDFAKLYTDMESSADRLSHQQWTMYSESAFRSLREGGEILAASAQAYQMLAASVRQTARQGGAGAGGITSALGALAILLPMFSGSCDSTNTIFGSFNSRPQDCCPKAAAS